MTHALRSAIGPLAIGASVWCAAGTIAIAAPDQTMPRLAAPAPWWVFVGAVAIAALIPAIRRRPMAALPALLATVAWWPIPLPPIGLLFTGPLAWLPIAAAVGLAVGAAPVARAARALGADAPGRASALAAVATLILVSATAWSAAPQSPGGDEPHYLVITQSLLEDGDIRVENNYRQRDYAAYYGGELVPHYGATGRSGQRYSVHAPGLAVLVAPGFAVAGYRGAEATLILLAAISGMLVWRIGWRATGDIDAAWFAWAAIATSTTFLIQGFTIYPDGPAMLAVALGSLLLLHLGSTMSPPSSARLAAMSLPLAVLPWLHSRLSVVAAVFGAAIVWRLMRESGRSTGERAARLAAFAAVPALSALSWFAFFRLAYGTFNPAAAYGDSAGNHWQYVPGGALAILFDGQFGLVTYAPVVVAAVAGWWRPRTAASRRVGLETLIVMGAYLAAAMTYWMWWGGRPAPPARFIAGLLPALAIPLASAWAGGDRLRRAALVALICVGAGFALVAIGSAHGATAWNDRDAESRLLGFIAPIVNLRRAWPAFFWTLAPDFSFTNLGSEWRFAGHVAVFLGVFTGLWFLVRLVVGGPGRQLDDFRARAASVVWLLAGLVAAVQSGWWLRGVSGLDAEPAQARLVGEARRGVALVSIETLRVSRRSGVDAPFTLASQEVGKADDPAPWYIATHLPAGDYEVTLTMERPAAGSLIVATHTASDTRDVRAAATQTWPLHLSGDDGTVVIVPGEALRNAGGRVTLSTGRRPRTTGPGT